MALPSLTTAKYELTLPSSGEKVEFRPFLVKEEKILMIAQQSDDQAQMVRAIEDIITACTFGKLNTSALPFFDIEYVFLQLRAKSIGETTTITVVCPDDNTTKVPLEINITDIKCQKDENHSNKIELTDTVGVIMNYPRLNSLTSLGDDTESIFKVVKESIKEIYDADNVYSKNDMDSKELDDFIESMSHEQFLKVQHFFETLPRVRHSVTVKNPNTGVDNNLVLEGLDAFF